jgi:G patch domain-containing protein 1
MGWQIGQGIGPRLTWRQRHLQGIQLSTGRGPSSGYDSSIPDDEKARKYTYEPCDTQILLVGWKDNSHGLGYDPGIGLHEVHGIKDVRSPSAPKLVCIYTYVTVRWSAHVNI